MEARVKFRPDTLKQKGSVGKVLLWMQKNPNRLRNTNFTILSKTLALEGYGKQFTIREVLYRLTNCQMISRYGNKRRANFYINYFHPQIPGYVLENAPKEEKERIDEFKSSLKPNQYIDEQGCKVTESEEKKEEEPTTTIIDEIAPNDSKPEEVINESSSDMSEENTTSVPIKVVDTERGLSISITLNLNINK